MEYVECDLEAWDLRRGMACDVLVTAVRYCAAVAGGGRILCALAIRNGSWWELETVSAHLLARAEGVAMLASTSVLPSSTFHVSYTHGLPSDIKCAEEASGRASE